MFWLLSESLVDRGSLFTCPVQSISSAKERARTKVEMNERDMNGNAKGLWSINIGGKLYKYSFVRVLGKL